MKIGKNLKNIVEIGEFINFVDIGGICTILGKNGRRCVQHLLKLNFLGDLILKIVKVAEIGCRTYQMISCI